MINDYLGQYCRQYEKCVFLDPKRHLRVWHSCSKVWRFWFFCSQTPAQIFLWFLGKPCGSGRRLASPTHDGPHACSPIFQNKYRKYLIVRPCSGKHIIYLDRKDGKWQRRERNQSLVSFAGGIGFWQRNKGNRKNLLGSHLLCRGYCGTGSSSGSSVISVGAGGWRAHAPRRN